MFEAVMGGEGGGGGRHFSMAVVLPACIASWGSSFALKSSSDDIRPCLSGGSTIITTNSRGGVKPLPTSAFQLKISFLLPQTSRMDNFVTRVGGWRATAGFSIAGLVYACVVWKSTQQAQAESSLRKASMIMQPCFVFVITRSI